MHRRLAIIGLGAFLLAARPTDAQDQRRPPDAATILKHLDRNGDKRISRSEARGPLADHFDDHDRNGDGYLTVDEVGPPQQGPASRRGQGDTGERREPDGETSQKRARAIDQSRGAEVVEGLRYPIVDTGQRYCYGTAGGAMNPPAAGAALFGQDAQYVGHQPDYTDNKDGTITDNVTGLTWQKTYDRKAKRTWAEAVAGAKTCRTGGHDDWRFPTIKELYSLILFSGGMGFSTPRPYLDVRYFDFVYGDSDKGERDIDAQYWSSTQYVGLTMDNNWTIFGVNFADGRIKGYPRDRGRRGVARMYVRYVRGNPHYGKNDFVDNKDGTITDRATGLTWTRADSGRPLDWQQALAWAEGLKLAGHDDWRLPNAKELQSIVDYTRAPDPVDKKTPTGPAIDPMFQVSKTESYFWTSTSHLDQKERFGSQACYVAFGRAMGYFGRDNQQKRWMDVHGAGAQRSDPKTGNPKQFPTGRGPQGDDVRVYNYVRAVRGGAVLRAR